MTYHTLIARLRACNVDNPIGEAAALSLQSVDWCMLHREQEVSDEVEARLLRREAGEPLFYILGEAWFYGYRFKVSPDCLIPQPDTEHLVYHALSHLNGGGSLLDLCTGSGCIAISILKENPDISAAALELSPSALRIARQNAALHQLAHRLRFLECDVLTAPCLPDLIAAAHVIVSNPPYIRTDVIPTLSEEVQHEPVLALDGGADGLKFYRRFILDYTAYMQPNAIMLLEIGYDQAETILSLCRQAHVFCNLHKDFGGNIRVAEIFSPQCQALPHT